MTFSDHVGKDWEWWSAVWIGLSALGSGFRRLPKSIWWHKFTPLNVWIHAAPGPTQPILAAAVFANGCRNLGMGMTWRWMGVERCRVDLFCQPRSPPPASGGSKTAFATSTVQKLRRIKEHQNYIILLSFQALKQPDFVYWIFSRIWFTFRQALVCEMACVSVSQGTPHCEAAQRTWIRKATIKVMDL